MRTVVGMAFLASIVACKAHVVIIAPDASDALSDAAGDVAADGNCGMATCPPAMCAAPGSFYGPCNSDADCSGLSNNGVTWRCVNAHGDSTSLVPRIGFSGGMCSRHCTDSAMDCPCGVCIDTTGSPVVYQICQPSCTSGGLARGDCRVGYQCTNFGSSTYYCDQDCTMNSDCGGGAMCNTATNACF